MITLVLILVGLLSAAYFFPKARTALYLAFCLMCAYGSRAQAGETRFLTAMPTANKVTIKEMNKSKKPGYECFKVKQNAKGNAARLKNTKSYWFSDVPADQDDKADAQLIDGKTAIKCQLKLFSKGKMRSADVGDEAE